MELALLAHSSHRVRSFLDFRNLLTTWFIYFSKKLSVGIFSLGHGTASWYVLAMLLTSNMYIMRASPQLQNFQSWLNDGRIKFPSQNTGEIRTRHVNYQQALDLMNADTNESAAASHRIETTSRNGISSGSWNAITACRLTPNQNPRSHSLFTAPSPTPHFRAPSNMWGKVLASKVRSCSPRLGPAMRK